MIPHDAYEEFNFQNIILNFKKRNYNIYIFLNNEREKRWNSKENIIPKTLTKKTGDFFFFFFFFFGDLKSPLIH